MSKVASGHPGEEQLLRYADGELSPRESAGVRTHLEACWECRAELDRVQAAVTDCIHYRKAVLEAHLPPPPAPWRDLSAGFAAVNRELAAERPAWWRSLWQAVAAPRFWAPALAAGLALVLVVLPWLRETPTVQAAELLRQAVVAAEGAEAAKPALRKKLAVRSRTRQVTYAAGSPELKPVAQMFAAARYNWNDPLSAKSYLAWHDQLTAKTDEVIASPAGDFYHVRTLSETGEIREATLRLRRADLHPVEGTFRFRNGEWIEVTEAAEVSTVSSTAIPAAGARGPKSTLPPSSAAEAAAAAPATVSDELHVLAALHRLGADLGDPIEIMREGPSVAVKCFGLDARRQAQVAGALAGLTAVRLHFASEGTVADPTALAAAGRPAVAVRSGRSEWQPQLEAQLGSPAAVEQLANEVFDRNESIMERAYAIRRLAARFPDTQAWNAPDRALLHSMLRAHAGQLARQQRELSGVLKPVLPAGKATLAAAAARPATAESVFLAAKRLETSLTMLLSAGTASGDPVSLPARIVAQLGELEQLTRNYAESMGQ